jgi:hypothetical protein
VQTASGRSGAIVLPCVVGALSVVFLLGMMGASVSSSGRRSVEWVRAHELARQAAASAFDEAGAVLAETVQAPALDDPSGSRDLNQVVKWPQTLDVPLTRQAFAVTRAEPAAVGFASGNWVLQSSTVGDFNMAIREVALVELTVVVTVQASLRSTPRRIKVTVQRYASAAPGLLGSAVALSPYDLTHSEVDL